MYLLVAFVYFGLGPRSTGFDFQLSQANNILHGHLDLVPEHTRNITVLERVLFDGTGFCLPEDDPRGPERRADFTDPRLKPDCRTYLQHALGPAILLLPLVALFGLALSQTLVCVLFGALAAPLALSIARRFTTDRRTIAALTALFAFGTTFWYSAADGGVWHFAHVTAVVFLLAAIRAAVVSGSPLATGAFIGMAYLCRPTTVLAGLFALAWFADRWYVPGPGIAALRRIRPRPLVALAVGVLPFLLLGMLLNVLRFGSPFESGYNYTEQLYQLSTAWRWPHGWFDVRYIPRHIAVAIGQMPIVSPNPPFIWPSWAGLALWVTTPAVLLIPFIHLRRAPRIAIPVALLLACACAFLLARGVTSGLGAGAWAMPIAERGLELLPFGLAYGLGLLAALVARDRLVLACWAAILAIGLATWTFAATGWAQFGYRYALDVLPFLYLLIVRAVVPRARPAHLVLIGLGIIVNLWGVLWIFSFNANRLFDLAWVGF
ncbi:MAG: hypothetical protein ACKOTZ_10105 [Chloroflexota bacterium]